MPVDTEARENTVLILAPVGQDAALTAKVLARSGVRSEICQNLNELCQRLSDEAHGAIFIAEEALTSPGVTLLNQALSSQPPWSDIPVILATGGGALNEASARVWRDLAVSGNVTLLERPARTLILISVAQVALRARRRQYQVRQLLKEQKDATALRDEFISIASHELKNPISSLKLQLQLNRLQIRKPNLESVPADRVIRLIDRTEQIAERLNRLVDDMLDASRLQAGKLRLELQEVDLVSLVEDIAERFVPRLSGTGNTLNLDLDAEITGRWDPFRLEQVLVNLLTNAQRYAPGTPLQLSVRRKEDRVRIVFRDQGPGIAPENLERIFRRFERVSEATQVPGLGLGLYICREIIEGHGGGIRAESEPGKGATFIIDLPLRADVAGLQEGGQPFSEAG